MLSRQIKGKRDAIPLHNTYLVNFPWGGMLSRQIEGKRDAIPLHSTYLVNFPWGGMLSRQTKSKRDAIPLHSTEDRFGHLRTTVRLQKGESRVALCRCFQSKDFPFCDGTHKTLPTNAGPVIVEVTPPEARPEV